MNAGDALLDLVLGSGRRSLFVVGTGKNAGKTVAMRAIASSAARRGMSIGLTSAGRDGETFDAVDAVAKPRLFLAAGTVIATAEGLLPRSLQAEILDVSDWTTAAGNVVFARVCNAAFYELAGPPKASQLRDCIDRFFVYGCELAIVDGAIDRVAGLAGGNDAVVAAVGADSGSTVEQAARSAYALVARLQIPPLDPAQPFESIEGALTAERARTLLDEQSRGQIVVRDPTRVLLDDKTLLRLRERLRCEKPLHVIAVTVAPVGREREHDRDAFRAAVASATGLPVFDVFADAVSV